jgi:tetratricopeptide (TPR) repeat protein
MAFDLAKKIESQAKSDRDTLALCRVNLELGMLYNHVGKLIESTERFRRQLSFAKAIESLEWSAKALNNIGGNYLMMESFDSALVYLEEACELKRANGDVSGFAKTSVNLSSLYRNLGQKELAFEKCKESLQVLMNESDKEPYYTTLVNFAALNIDAGEFQRSDSLLRIVLDEANIPLYKEQYLQALENYCSLLYNTGDVKTGYDSLISHRKQKAIFVNDLTRARIQELEVQHAKAEKQLEVDRAELLAEKRKSKILILLVGLIVAVIAALLWVSRVRSRSRERTRILNQSYERETKRISDLVWSEIALSVDGKGSSLSSGKEMSQEALRGAMGALDYLRHQQKNPYLQVGLNRALEDLFVARPGRHSGYPQNG